MPLDSIGGVKITREKPFLILEAGVNHEGSLDTAFTMIDAAAESGADMIKFQSYKAETLASRHSPSYWDRTKEPASSQYELFRKYDAFGDEEYRRLADRCRQKGILFSSTPFDSHFADFLEPLMPVYKVASADITNAPLLRQIAAKGKPMLLSTGASHLAEIDEALRLVRDAGDPPVALLHCVLEYPTAPEHANLKSIPYLHGVYPNLTLGWSDHVPPDHGSLSLLAAWMLGADILEKHFTLNKSLPGNDHYHALDPDDTRDFISAQRQMQLMLGSCGKTVLPWEADARRQARRSLVAARDIPAGTSIEADMLTAKRPGLGLSPQLIDLIVGRVAKRDILEDETLDWDLV